ncbi:hypothetical protein [Sphaerisporangium fuscum]|uniref:hypothetical protein n=1 Tax=Sphaerisporangium fuscum TaxID=2835868 RepID=UPI001BDD0804|nr:hypothetical protein [Sphaerisporangium fuscum]
MTGLGTVLLVASLRGRYGLAGEVAAAGSAGYALVSPLVAQLADRFGQGRVLPPLMLLYGVSTVGLIACAHLRAPGWALMGRSGLAGAATPQLGSMVRARWSALLGGSPLLQAAFSLESVADEVLFVAGPVLVTLLATEISRRRGWRWRRPRAWPARCYWPCSVPPNLRRARPVRRAARRPLRARQP